VNGNGQPDAPPIQRIFRKAVRIFRFMRLRVYGRSMVAPGSLSASGRRFGGSSHGQGYSRKLLRTPSRVP